MSRESLDWFTRQEHAVLSYSELTTSQDRPFSYPSQECWVWVWLTILLDYWFWEKLLSAQIYSLNSIWEKKTSKWYVHVSDAILPCLANFPIKELSRTIKKWMCYVNLLKINNKKRLNYLLLLLTTWWWWKSIPEIPSKLSIGKVKWRCPLHVTRHDTFSYPKV